MLRVFCCHTAPHWLNETLLAANAILLRKASSVIPQPSSFVIPHAAKNLANLAIRARFFGAVSSDRLQALRLATETKSIIPV